VNEDATVEEFAGFEPVGATAHRRDSYQQAVHADHGTIDKLYADVVLADQVNVEEDLGVTASAALEEILECEKEGSGTGESSTRADILDNGSEDLNVEDSPETSRRSSASG